MNIFCFGISHQTADVKVRERFAIPDSALADSLTRLARIRSVDEGILLSTCNRTEFYIVSPDSQLAVEPLFHEFYGPLGTTEFQHLFRLPATATIRHLFRDILVSSTAAPHAVVTRAKIEPILRMRRDRPLFIIDLAIPRDVEPTVHELNDVYVYDLDSLHAIADRTLETRKKEMDACNSLIEKHVSDFEFSLDRASERVISPARSSAARREDDYTWGSRQPVGMGRG